MPPELLHQHLRRSLQNVIVAEFLAGLRALLESGSAERLLADLLFISLYTAGYDVSREFPIGARAACDLVIHESKDIFVEAKQLHLKDGCKYAPSNLSRDLSRHLGQPSLGVIYVLDERASTLKRRYKRFGDMNRNAKGRIDDIISGLKDAFAVVFPNDTKAAMLKRFDNQGSLDIFGFVVAEPIARSP